MIARGDGSQIRALVVDGATSQRARLIETLREDGDIAVVGQPTTTSEAIDAVATIRPDVVVLELHLAGGESRHAIEQIMAHTPTPILVLSAGLDDRDSPSVVEALVTGALEALPRPAQWTSENGERLRRTVRQISKVHVIRHPRGNLTAPVHRVREQVERRQPVVAIAASTGGPSALAILLSGLAGLQAPVLVVQHLHPDFTGGLVEWMSRVSPLPVETARHQQVVRAGRIYIAPGERHLRYCGNGRLELDENPATVHRPSADELFRSVAEAEGEGGIGVLLTGMGEDGARGLLAIHQRGGRTIAQDRESSAVFGMPKAAQRLGAVTTLHPLNQIADVIQRAVREMTP